MLFNTTHFFEFLLVVLLLFWVTPQRFKYLVLLLASYLFYSFWEPAYTILLLGSTLIDFVCVKYLTSSNDKSKSKLGLFLSVISNLVLLGVFKYYDFFVQSLQGLTDHSFSTLNLLLPIGISFYTFQSIAYSVDVYRNHQKPELSFLRFALYLSFFPQLVAGPIERAKDLLPQLNKKRFQLSVKEIQVALWYILLGLFYKAVLADNCATIVDPVFDQLSSYSGAKVTFASLLFAVQIYGDFAGYSFMAIGIAGLFGVQLRENFNRPFWSQSLTDLWKRWHMSLTDWFRDYLYIPLGGNRKGVWRTAVNLLVVFLLVGLWHGAAWTFVMWGLLNGMIMMLERVFGMNSDSRNKLFSRFRMLLIFVVFTMCLVAFRSSTIQEAFVAYEKIFSVDFRELMVLIYDYRYTVVSFSILIVFLFEWSQRNRFPDFSFKSGIIFRWSLIIIMLFSTILMGVDNGEQFIYFNF